MICSLWWASKGINLTLWATCQTLIVESCGCAIWSKIWRARLNMTEVRVKGLVMTVVGALVGGDELVAHLAGCMCKVYVCYGER